MPDQAHHARLRADLDVLLRGLEPAWSGAALDYLREDVARDEFGEALENLIGFALREGHPLSSSERRQVEHLARLMGLADSPDLARLLSAPLPPPPAVRPSGRAK